MPDSTAIALAGISATALAPLLGQLLSHRRDGAQRAHELARSDIVELRELVDQTAQNVARALELYREVRSRFLQLGARFDVSAREVADQFRQLGLQVDVDTVRLEIRLGTEHPLCEAHREVAEAIRDVVQYVWVAVSLGEHADIQQTWETVMQRGGDMHEAGTRFTTQAALLIGSRLPK